MNSGAPCVDVPYRYTPIIGRKNPSCDVNKVTKIGLDRGPRGAYSSICCLQPQVVRHLREWRNRQTRTVQVRVPVRAWGFNSPLAHQLIPGSVEPGIFYTRHTRLSCVSAAPSGPNISINIQQSQTVVCALRRLASYGASLLGG